MNEVTLKEAISEAERFISRAKNLLEALNDIPYVFNVTAGIGLVEQASTDLSRALSTLRRYGD